MASKFSFVSIGECMIELSHSDSNTLKMNFAGDTLNTVTYFARLIDRKKFTVEYVTALGDDPYSERMLKAWETEGIGHDQVRRIPGKLPGLYLIETNSNGERSFYFYRSTSAARFVFTGDEGTQLCHQLSQFNGIYFSSIALAILDDSQRLKLFQALAEAREHNAQIFFDTNFRASLWDSKEQAQTIIQEALKWVDIALPSFEDEQTLFKDQNYALCAQRIHSYGVKEVVVKHGEHGYYLSSPNLQEYVAVKPQKNVVDTTGAGDSFNGAYLALRLQGKSMQEAARFAAELAATVIQHRGAIISHSAMPNYNNK